jgi:succinate dehydrogenase/fumarate reductase flavoprotein subunit
MGDQIMKAEKKNGHLTRRKFLKTAAASAGATTLAGIGSKEAVAVQQNQISKWDYEAGIVVLGIGGAGLVSAITARDQGADVLIIEKASEAHAGGNTRVCMQGVWCPPNLNEAITYQKALNGRYPVPDEVFQAYHEYTTKSFEWLKRTCSGKISQRPASNGAEFPELPGAASGYMCGSAEGWGYSRLWKMLKEAADKRQVKILYEMPGMELVQDFKTSEIRGVIAERQGKKIYVKAKKAVILCTGGYENNQEMIRDYLLLPCAYPFGSPYNTGDGIKMAQAVGADLWHMANVCGPVLSYKAPGFEWAFGAGFTLPAGGYIFVASDATRFVNENQPARHGKVAYHGTYVHPPLPLPVHAVFDEIGRKSGPLYRTDEFWCWHGVIEKYKWSADSSVELEKGWILKADTIRELALKMGKNPDALEKSLATWNRSCAAGNDSEFGRPKERMIAIQTPPYYAMELVPAFVNTLGGPRHNGRAQVLDTNRKPIPRLYSAGELGSVFSYGYQGAGNFSECVAFGRIAGEHAAAEKPWS